MKIAVTALGSFGDLNPFFGIALELKRRGHEVVIATSPVYADAVHQLGLAFHPIAPDLRPDNSELIAAVLDRWHGAEKLLKQFIFPTIEASFNDFLPLAKSCDLMIGGILSSYAAIASEITGKPWVSGLLSPLPFWSGFDPPVLAPMPWLASLPLPAFVHRAIVRGLLKSAEAWAEPIFDLRRKLGLPRGGNPLGAGIYSPNLLLGLFSPLIGDKQADWPAQTEVTGFVFFDGGQGKMTLEPELENFLAAGDAPLIFTLGSTSVLQPGSLFETFTQVAQQLRRRAVLLVGKEALPRFASLASKQIYIGDVAPYSLILPRGAATIHQGGIGTTAQALRAGKPMLVLPWCNDQYDNAHRARRLGATAAIQLNRLTVPRLCKTLSRLLDDPRGLARASDIGRQLQQENGTGAAADWIEKTYENQSN